MNRVNPESCQYRQRRRDFTFRNVSYHCKIKSSNREQDDRCKQDDRSYCPLEEDND